jgi:serine/threonine protein kinase
MADGRPIALKRIRKDAHASSALRELRVGQVLSAALGGDGCECGLQAAHAAGLSMLCAPLDSFATAKHVWIAYEKGGQSLGQLCYRWRGATVSGERLYDVTPQPFYMSLARHGPAAFGALAADLLLALSALHALGVAHNDVKPDNILVRHAPDAPHGFCDLRLIDFGSATLSGTALMGNVRAASQSMGSVPAAGQSAGGGSATDACGRRGCQPAQHGSTAAARESASRGGFNTLHVAPSPEFAPPEMLALSTGVAPGGFSRDGTRAAYRPPRRTSSSHAIGAGALGGAGAVASASDALAAATEAARALALDECPFGVGDVWSAGAVLLELCAGVPLWFS